VTASADGGEDGDLVAVVQLGEIAGEGFVAVDPDARVVEHGGEVGAVRRAEVVEQCAERRRRALVVTATRRLARLREQPDADGQRSASWMSWMLVRAVGNASRRAGSMGWPVSSSMP
jgi:hypothetical protein